MKETKRVGSFLLGKSEHECMGFGRDEVCKWTSIIPSLNLTELSQRLNPKSIPTVEFHWAWDASLWIRGFLPVHSRFLCVINKGNSWRSVIEADWLVGWLIALLVPNELLSLCRAVQMLQNPGYTLGYLSHKHRKCRKYLCISTCVCWLLQWGVSCTLTYLFWAQMSTTPTLISQRIRPGRCSAQLELNLKRKNKGQPGRPRQEKKLYWHQILNTWSCQGREVLCGNIPRAGQASIKLNLLCC